VPGNLGGRVQGGRIAGIILADGAAEGGYSFVAPGTIGRIAGRVYVDLYRDGVYGPGDLGVATIRVIIAGVDDRGASVKLATTTAADGSFSFEGLRPGIYTLREVLPRFFRDQGTVAGTSGGKAHVARIGDISLAAEAIASGYNFGTLPRASCNLYPLIVRPGGAGHARSPSHPSCEGLAQGSDEPPIRARIGPNLARDAATVGLSRGDRPRNDHDQAPPEGPSQATPDGSAMTGTRPDPFSLSGRSLSGIPTPSGCVGIPRESTASPSIRRGGFSWTRWPLGVPRPDRDRPRGEPHTEVSQPRT
jgi:hypothetical protein